MSLLPPNTAERRPLLNVAEVASRLRISTKTAYRLAAIGELPAVRVGAQLRFNPDAIDDYVQPSVDDVEERIIDVLKNADDAPTREERIR